MAKLRYKNFLTYWIKRMQTVLMCFNGFMAIQMLYGKLQGVRLILKKVDTCYGKWVRGDWADYKKIRLASSCFGIKCPESCREWIWC